jgi:hypothetical protein
MLPGRTISMRPLVREARGAVTAAGGAAAMLAFAEVVEIHRVTAV